MGYVKNEDVIGYNVESSGVFCRECFNKERGDDAISEDEIITEQDRENYDGLIFCDSCKKEI